MKSLRAKLRKKRRSPRRFSHLSRLKLLFKSISLVRSLHCRLWWGIKLRRWHFWDSCKIEPTWQGERSLRIESFKISCCIMIPRICRISMIFTSLRGQRLGTSNLPYLVRDSWYLRVTQEHKWLKQVILLWIKQETLNKAVILIILTRPQWVALEILWQKSISDFTTIAYQRLIWDRVEMWLQWCKTIITWIIRPISVRIKYLQFSISRSRFQIVASCFKVHHSMIWQ